ncbi:MAG: cupin domain-containing protein [Bacteroidetes bacterium]|nr:cupin domain-containing protein [Bacteroidota bacterium]
MHEKSKYYINNLEHFSLVEGGYFKENYRSNEFFQSEYLPARFTTNKNFSTSIYFLLDCDQVSAFHRLKSDEIWHYYDGSSVKIFEIEEDGNLMEFSLGKNLDEGEMFQVVIKRNSWFAAEVTDKNSYCLIGCTVSPGFDYGDFELADRTSLIKQFPQYEEIIKKFTKFKK